MMKKNQILLGNSLEILKKIPDKSVNLVFADPPYNLQLKDTLYRPDQTIVIRSASYWKQIRNFEELVGFARDS